jgi:hypothetical protein
MKLPSRSRIMVVACVLALCALALFVWSLLDPRPIPVIAAMSAGQVIGTLSFGAFLFVVLTDLRSRYKEIAAPKTELPKTPE